MKDFMYYLFAAVLAFFLTGIPKAFAENIAAIQNKGGGAIVLTDTPCSTKNMAVVYSFTKEGNAAYGCWVYAEPFVHVTWSDGDSRIYHANDFTVLTKSQPGKRSF